MRANAPRHAFAIGLVASALVHLLLVALDPEWQMVVRWRPPDAALTVQQPVAPRQVLTFTTPEQPAAAPAVAAPQPTTGRTGAPAPAPLPATPAAGAAPPRSAPPTLRPAERLRYRPGPLWAPLPRPAEAPPECAPIDLNARLAEAIAEGRYPLAPAPDPRGDRRSTDVPLLRIPVGKKPPPPPVFLPAPVLPDSMRVAAARADSARGASARGDSPPGAPAGGNPVMARRTDAAAASRSECADTTRRLVPRLRGDTIRP